MEATINKSSKNHTAKNKVFYVKQTSNYFISAQFQNRQATRPL